MRDNRIIPGVVLVMLGTAFLLHNYGIINLHWHNFFALWPIFIVIAGVNLLFKHNPSAWATVIRLVVIVGGLGLILFGNFGNRYSMWPGVHYQVDDDNDDDDIGSGKITKVEGNSNFVEPYTADARHVKLKISGGGTNYILKDTTNQLFTADTKEFYGRYEFNPNMGDSIKVLDFKMSGNHNFNWGGHNKSNSATIKLNVNPEWDIDINAGATSLDFDLSKFKIRSLDINGGAASFDVKLGQPLDASNIDISTGVSDVNISIPTTAACSIKKHSGLSSSDFEGFIKKDDGSYETPGFATAKNKFYIKINGGVSDFNVKRY